MNQALHNFARADEIIRSAERFYGLAARAFDMDQLTEGAPVPGGDRRFLSYINVSLLRLTRRLCQYRLHHDAAGLVTWVQYTPEGPLPSSAELACFDLHERSVDALVDYLVLSDRQWAALFDELAERAPTVAAAELFTGCRTLIGEWAQTLASAELQRYEA